MEGFIVQNMPVFSVEWTTEKQKELLGFDLGFYWSNGCRQLMTLHRNNRLP